MEQNGQTVHTLIGRTMMAAVKAYQLAVSPLLGDCCRFHPSCSAYCMAAIKKYGCLKGVGLSIARICRCHPFHPGGVDHP